MDNPHELGTLAFKVFAMFSSLVHEIVGNEIAKNRFLQKYQAEKDLDWFKIHFQYELEEFVYPYLKEESEVTNAG